MANDIKWLAPENGWVKLNTYGAILLNTFSTAIGRVIKDAYGNWLRGYSMVLGKDEVLLIGLY
ncbi:hypothetical protein PVK06_017079 [Gossypium arboreum]|uniref:Uncharacterized protein n=1 Tax=Gossypium arboreum TaxID=29729 RepID=A0ABR0Q1P9_GOSAR|nr:hypothetical protein PVK06_017079 [Gossypium arboreum]